MLTSVYVWTVRHPILTIFAGVIVAILFGIMFAEALDAKVISLTNPCSHATQSIHEIPAPSSWPGTRAAHTVYRFTASIVHYVYTKSGWWDPTWDFYYSAIYAC